MMLKSSEPGFSNRKVRCLSRAPPWNEWFIRLNLRFGVFFFQNPLPFIKSNFRSAAFGRMGSDLPLAARPTKVRSGVGFSDATGAAFELRVALPGVGEALKREIAGLVWVDR